MKDDEWKERAEAAEELLSQVLDDRDHYKSRTTSAESERDSLRAKLDRAKEALGNAVAGIEAWCKAIDEKGTAWDDWDEHYKDFYYRGGLDDLRAVLAELSVAAPAQAERDRK